MNTVLFTVSGVETWPWLPPLAALVISLFTSMVGISGAFLLVPFQLSVLGFASPSASATNLVFNLIAIPGGMLRYWRENRLFWPLALVITLGGGPGTLAGAWLRTHWLAKRETFEYFVAAILLYLAWRMLADLRRKVTAAPSHEPVRLLAWDRRILRFAQGDHEYAVPLASLLVFSFLVGVIGTAYGIGGGSFMVPICLAFYGLPLHAIAGATLTATFLTSGIALAAYAWLPVPAGVAARPDWWLGLAFGLGGLVGAYLGARFQRRVPQRVLRGFLVLLLLGLALRYLWPGSPGP
jgi:uncharacterized protein